MKVLRGGSRQAKPPASPDGQLPSCRLQVCRSPGGQLAGCEAKPPRMCLILCQEGGLCLSLPPR